MIFTKEFKNIGLSKKIIKRKNYLVKQKNSNYENMFKILNIAKLNKFRYIPKIKEIDNYYYRYKYIKGFTLSKIQTIDIKIILLVLSIIIKLQLLYKENGKVINHNDISPLNVVFNKKT
ncbi:hypothetical protein SCORR_v1c06020 [Spiroplasma corruscae]|uniref:Protein kinase domain-containing protein n=1 Tax=Spiroplasma corruscae TaxID=216934 RepID=A0A222EQ19_9MOLU|nr:hypothetical protein [Spiroplasma corruscae]ASP28374.1 hypothetical protein SCORR_v1c06020 [Spiroplasma corruscae]